MSVCARLVFVAAWRAAVANISLVKAYKARKIEDIMNAQRGAASCIIAAGEVTRWQV